jgi:hypothetical protein
MSRDHKRGDQHLKERHKPEQRLEDVIINFWNLLTNTYDSSSQF